MVDQPKSEVKRHLGVVLFADVAGYTRLMEQDEDRTWLELKNFLEQINSMVPSYDGKVKQVRGDGLFLTFLSPVNAVRFAIAIQDYIKNSNVNRTEDRLIEIRIGINLGDILIDGDEVIGDSVNIASRLQTLAKPGQICISSAVYEQVQNKLTCGFGYLGLQRLKNHREPIDVFEVRRDAAVATTGRRREELSVPNHSFSDLSVVVLPFQYQGAEPGDRWLADGLTEDITTNLSRFHELFVISRNSAYVFQDSGMGPDAAARELQVRYAVTGAIRKLGNRVRITVELTDAQRRKVIWGEQYKRAVDDLLDVQEEISNLIVSATAVQIHESERERVILLPPGDILAYGYVIKGQQHIFRYTQEDNRRARRLYETALSLDPVYARALAAKSRTLNIDWRYNWAEERQSLLDEALALARAAIEADPRDARGFGELGFVHLYRKEFDASINAYRRALTLNPNDADLLSDMGDALAHSGQSEEALALLHKAMQLNPYYPDQYLWHLAGAYYNLSRYEDAVSSILVMQNPTEGRRILAASYAQLGNISEARRHAQLMLAAHPDFSLDHWAAMLPDRIPEETARFVEGLRKAGL
jgi:adenylate cyclase